MIPGERTGLEHHNLLEFINISIWTHQMCSYKDYGWIKVIWYDSYPSFEKVRPNKK